MIDRYGSKYTYYLIEGQEEMDRDMNQELERTEELMQAASGKSKKKKIIIIAVIAGVIAAGIGVFAGINIHNSNQCKAQLKIAQTNFKEGKYDEAIAAYTKAIELDDSNADAYEGRADAYVKTGKSEKAVPDYHKAIEHNKGKADLYRKGVKASLASSNIIEADKFLKAMDENIGEAEADKLKEEEFDRVIKMAFENKLKELRKETVGSENEATMALEESAYFDMDGDGISELLTVSRKDVGSGRSFRAFAYRDGDVEQILEEDEYGMSRVEAYDETKAIVTYRSGHGSESYSYYKNDSGKYTLVATREREAVAGGGVKNGAWGYTSGERDENGMAREISEDEFNEITAKLIKGKSRKTDLKDWTSESNKVSDNDLTKSITLETSITPAGGSKAYSTVYAKNANGKTVWSYKSRIYQQAQIDSVYTGIKDGYVYICDDGIMVKLEKTTGKVVKKGSEELRGVVRMAFDDNENVYCAFFEGKAAKYDKDLDLKWNKEVRRPDNAFEISELEYSDLDDKLNVYWVMMAGEDEMITLDPDTGEEVQ